MKQISYRSFFLFFFFSLTILITGVVGCYYQIKPLLQTSSPHPAIWMTWLLLAGMLLLFGGLLFLVLSLHRRSHNQLCQVAYVDPLTGADNFNSMQTHFKEQLEQLGGKAALVVLDVLKFKVINDIHGYERGNEVLKKIAYILRQNLSEKERFCRLSADNFVLLLSFENKIALQTRLLQLAAQLRRECAAEPLKLIIEVALGTYEITDTTVPFYLMLDRAHIALKNAKGGALNKNQFFEETDRSRMVAEQQIENTMHNALNNREFEIYLQPKCDFATGQLRGAEALVRWNKSDGLIVRPDEFIPVFEKNGFILQLDMYIYEEAVRLLKEWKEKGLSLVPIAVNFSRLHLNDDRFVPQMRHVATKHNVDTHFLEVELTESVVFNNLQRAQSVLSNLHNYGFAVAMDDFGAGYSSLNVLKNLHFDSIKLDKEFLGGCESNPYAQNVIEGTVKMVKKLGIQVVAEGVETREQVDFLCRIGCDIAQGYFFSRPLKASAFEQTLPRA